jgi:hypothetical protein
MAIRVVGYVGWADVMQAEREFREAAPATIAAPPTAGLDG